MERAGIVTIILVLVTFAVSYKGFKDKSFRRRYRLDASRILISREYERLITAGFLHSNWMHFGFNMIALYSFGRSLETSNGVLEILLVYFFALVISNLLSVFINRNKSGYTSLGASGAISGVIYACIASFPQMKIGLIFIPGVDISAWIFGLIYMVYCMLGMRSQRDNIAHDAHLVGGLAGMVLSVLLHPYLLEFNYFPIAAISIPTLIFLYFVVTRPEFLMVEKPFIHAEGVHTIDDRYNASKKVKEMELDQLLDKISRNGIQSLSKKEKERLEELSKVK